MNKSPTVEQALSEYIANQTNAQQFCIGYSGGMDSHVLLHAMAALLKEYPQFELRAVYVDHGLQTDSQYWAAHCENTCEQLGVPLQVLTVDVSDTGDGPEASARMARYGAFAENLSEGEQLFLAQHADDQAETFLLQALRGSGPDGLASIPRKRVFAKGYLCRPLLPCLQTELEHYASCHALAWIDDPSNNDTAFDRNYLRQTVMPLLKERWPAAAQTLSRSAMRSAAAGQTLLGIAQEDLELVRLRGSSELSVSELRALPRERCYNVLRIWVRQAQLRMPRLQDLSQVLSNLINARDDSVGIVNVRDYEFRRHADRLYLLPPQMANEPFCHTWQAPFTDLHIPEINLTLTAQACRDQGIDLPVVGDITVRNRTGGELIKLGEPAFHKAVKKLLQESSVPPWQRDAIPLLYVDERLAAVWNIAVAVDFRTATQNSAEIA
jgi:tRNA(Ile)-lysidine synthase